MTAVFDIRNYLGKWYELLHYPTWFQRNDNYNTTAEYSMNADGTVRVVNSTIAQGKPFTSIGTGRYLGNRSMNVKFDMPEVAKLAMSKEFKPPVEYSNPNGPNYVVDSFWVNCQGEYEASVVTTPERNTLWVLCRTPSPSLAFYNEIMAYVVAKFDRDRLVQTPHYR
jgi:apolipoprotein D and lipocalin family protein